LSPVSEHCLTTGRSPNCTLSSRTTFLSNACQCNRKYFWNDLHNCLAKGKNSAFELSGRTEHLYGATIGGSDKYCKQQIHTKHHTYVNKCYKV